MRFTFLQVSIFFTLTIFAQNNNRNTNCDATKRPIVFVHGFLGSGDNWARQIQRFSSNGYCEDRMFVFDWNTISRSKSTDSLLNIFIDDVLQKTKSTQVDLVGHSAGGGLCYTYLSDSLHAAKVAHYVHIGSGKMKGAAGKNGEVATMNIYSIADMVVKGGGEIPGAVNIKQTTTDHFQVATGETTFVQLYSFLNNKQQPATLKIIPSKKYYRPISGKGLTMGENNPLSFDSVIAYSFNPATGKRNPNKRQPANNSITGWMRFSKDGSWGFQVAENIYTEFEVKPTNGRRVFYFFEPQVRSNKNMYLRTLPGSGMMAAVLNQLPNNEQQTVLVIFSANQAVIAGRDTLAIDSIPISTPVIAPASKTMIAAFVFDDGDGATSKQPIKTFSALPFLGSMDVLIPASVNGTMRIYYNGRTMVLPRRPSSEGVMIAVFD
jgi:Lipase (class 2)